MRLRFTFEQPDRARAIGANKIKQIGRGFRDAEKNGFGEGEPGDEPIDRRRLLRCEIGQPVCQSLLGLVRNGHMRSVHEARGQTLVRVALRGCGHATFCGTSGV